MRAGTAQRLKEFTQLAINFVSSFSIPFAYIRNLIDDGFEIDDNCKKTVNRKFPHTQENVSKIHTDFALISDKKKLVPAHICMRFSIGNELSEPPHFL